jgi:diguanylate cyclase (GGDEF)-like protein
MNRFSISTFIFLGFCLNICLLIFLPDNSNTVKLVIRLTSLAGLIWLIYFFFQYLGTEAEQNQKNRGAPDLLINIESLDNSAKSQFDELIKLTFTAIKDLNKDYEIAFYIIDLNSKEYILNNSTSEYFVSQFPIENANATNVLGSSDLNILYQKDNPEGWNNFFENKTWRGSESAILQPLLFNKNKAGFIIVRTDHFSDINLKDQLLIKHLSDIISLSIEDLDILDMAIIQSKNRSQIFNLLTEIDLSHSESEILNKFRNIIHYFFDYDCLTISMIEVSEKKATIKLIDGIKKYLPQENKFNINGTINGLPYTNNALINSSNSTFNLFRFSSTEDFTATANNFIGGPVYINEKLWGAIMLENFSKNPFKENDEKLLLLIIRAMQASMLWYTEYQNMYENAIKDGLTGLLNHKTFMDRARQEIERARRFQHHLVFLIYDLDKFKRINDTLGHPYGDYVIGATAKIIKDNVRSIDLVARYGGEEFAVVLVNTNTESAMMVAQRIVDNIADYNFNIDDKEVNMTISSGLSEYPNDSDTLSDLIQFADEGLYKTKDSGGNGVTIYHSIAN